MTVSLSQIDLGGALLERHLATEGVTATSHAVLQSTEDAISNSEVTLIASTVTEALRIVTEPKRVILDL